MCVCVLVITSRYQHTGDQSQREKQWPTVSQIHKNLGFRLTEFPPGCPASKPNSLVSLRLKCPQPSASQSVPLKALRRCPAPVSSSCSPGPRAAAASADCDLGAPAVATALELLPTWAPSTTCITSSLWTSSSPLLLIPQSCLPLDESHLGDKTSPSYSGWAWIWSRSSDMIALNELLCCNKYFKIPLVLCFSIPVFTLLTKSYSFSLSRWLGSLLWLKRGKINLSNENKLIFENKTKKEADSDTENKLITTGWEEKQDRWRGLRGKTTWF